MKTQQSFQLIASGLEATLSIEEYSAELRVAGRAVLAAVNGVEKTQANLPDFMAILYQTRVAIENPVNRYDAEAYNHLYGSVVRDSDLEHAMQAFQEKMAPIQAFSLAVTQLEAVLRQQKYNADQKNLTDKN